ncbi:MAG: 2-amino-4-hydroxy-6-hydroxymethyldihydropteridine diphosphokinase, partial [Mycobacteriales bacterium]
TGGGRIRRHFRDDRARAPMSRAVLSLGSNLGDRLATLSAALGLLAAADVVPVALSPVFETDAVGGPEQPDYLNAIAIVETSRPPYELLDVAQAVESGLGRERSVRWGARTVDIDIVVFDDLVSDDPRLTLPHPRAAERAFVLVPWLLVEPDAVLPDGRRIDQLVRDLGSAGVRRRNDLNLELIV